MWRQDHNGFSHQDPGFIDHVVNKKAEVIRVYLPPDANTLLSVADHCLRSRNYVNVVVAGKQPAPNWLSMDEAILHCTRGIGIWDFASSDQGDLPDVVMACAGDVPTLETLAAVDILRHELPDLKVRVVNVVDLMRLQPSDEHPHGLTDHEFDSLFTKDRPVVFAYHGYPWLIHRLTYRRTNHGNMHVRGYKEEGTTTTPFDMVMLNDLDRFHLVLDVIDRVPGLAARAGAPAPADGRPPAARHGHTPGSRARTRRRSATGRGRADRRGCGGSDAGVVRGGPSPILVVNAGSSSLKLRVLAADDRVVGSADLPAPRGSAADAAIAEAVRSFGPIEAVAHRVVHGGTLYRGPVRLDVGGRGAACGTDGPRADPPAEVARGDRRGQERAAGRARGRLLRHGVPRDDARRRDDLRRPARVAEAVADPALRVPRPLARVRVAPRSGHDGPAVERPADRHVPSRRGRVARGGRRRSLRGHDDGLHAARRARHGDAFRVPRSGARAVARAARRHAAGRAGGHAREPVGSARPCRDRRHAGDHRGRGRGRRGGASLPSACTSTACGPAIAAMTASLGGLDVLVVHRRRRRACAGDPGADVP